MRTRWLLSATAAACTATPSSGEQAVTNGALDESHPAVVALVNGDGRVGCTATVIGPHTAITAAHCVAGRDPRTLRVFFGTTVGDGIFVPVSDARAHPEFDAVSLARDVAVFTLRDESPVPPLALDTRAIDDSLIGTTFSVVGFGVSSSASDDGGQKRTGTARVSEVRADELTAVPAPSQACRGDSGGPALFDDATIAAVVSRGDSACADHSMYVRLDVVRATFIDPYLAETGPGTAQTGVQCFYDAHCAEGPCLQTHDDPLLYFCSRACTRDSECPAPMVCASDGCRYPEPSPGALGSSCEVDTDCTSKTCQGNRCTLRCLGMPEVCPEGFACTGTGLSFYCTAEADDCGGCASGEPGAIVIALIWLARARRSGRSSSPGGTRAARSG